MSIMSDTRRLTRDVVCFQPIILDVLADNGCLDLAYRMLLEQKSPSWLYPVLMGATTIVSLG